ncbi:MAG: N-acetylglucosamine-6-phosphate deacetylase [bacterium]|nr:N-acetylglucosamine-6-phosphate deacetylase [bacterium]
MVSPLLVKNAKLVTLTGQTGWLLCEDGRITQIGDGSPPEIASVQSLDAAGLSLLPGFIDLHVHGAMNREAMDADADALKSMARFYAQHGVTAFLATTWTDTQSRIQAALETIAATVGPMEDGATLLGAHLEGPYLNPSKCGAQNLDHIRRATPQESLPWLNLNVIRLLAVAPEYTENHWLIEACVERGITVSAAHTTATYDDMRRAVDLGLRQTTHTYNAMTPLGHREPGTVGAALTLPQLRCELIADNIHVHPAAMHLLWLAKGQDGVILISDAVRSAGMPDGDYAIDERVVTMRDGAVRLPDGTLAGSALTMDKAVFNFMQAVDAPLSQMWQTSSLNAARAIGVDSHKGSIEVGKDADLVLVDEQINVHYTIAVGRPVFQKQPLKL